MATIAERIAPTEVMVGAKALFDSGASWPMFFRQIMGIDGIVRRCYPDLDSFRAFEGSEDYRQLERWLAALRGNKQHGTDEPDRVITVRLPQSVHEALRHEAYDCHTSMNKLCVSKLLARNQPK